MLAALAVGLALGLSAGISPGPLLALLVSEALARGRAAGLAVAAAPLVTDAPIVLVTLLVLGRLEDSATALGLVAVAGGVVLVWFGTEGIRFRGASLPSQRAGASPWASLARGVAANFLNPHPYLFWLTVGPPLVHRFAAFGWAVVVAFFVAFYVGLVGSKAVLAVLVAGSARTLRSRGYVLANRGLGAVLVLLGALLLGDGLVRLLPG